MSQGRHRRQRRESPVVGRVVLSAAAVGMGVVQLSGIAAAAPVQEKSVVDRLKEELELHGVNCEVKGRAKHPASIWRKMERQSVKVDEVPDLLAFRIMAPDLGTCYLVLGLVHAAVGMRLPMTLITRVAKVFLMSTRQSSSPSMEISSDHGLSQVDLMSHTTGSIAVAELKYREQLCGPGVVA